MTAPHEPAASDQQLLVRLKQSAAKHGYTPGALLLAGETMAEFQKYAMIPVSGPFPAVIDEAVIDDESLAQWPGWVSELVSPGSKWKRLHWADGCVTIRLLNPSARVLAAVRLPENEKQTHQGFTANH